MKFEIQFFQTSISNMERACERTDCLHGTVLSPVRVASDHPFRALKEKDIPATVACGSTVGKKRGRIPLRAEPLRFGTACVKIVSV